jgi:hypothetical protein
LAKALARPPVVLSRVMLQNKAMRDIAFALRDIKEDVGSLNLKVYGITECAVP